MNITKNRKIALALGAAVIVAGAAIGTTASLTGNQTPAPNPDEVIIADNSGDDAEYDRPATYQRSAEAQRIMDDIDDYVNGNREYATPVANKPPFMGGEEDRAIRDQVANGQRPSATVTTDNPWLTWALPLPGMAMAVQSKVTDTGTCTLGAYVTDPNTNKVTALTAGHCFDPNKSRQAEWKRPGDAPLVSLGTATYIQERDQAGRLPNTDVALIPVRDGTRIGTWIANTYQITEVYDYADLEEGMEVCKFGYRTAETCGEIISANDMYGRAHMFSLSGDSGAPVYVKLGNDKVALLGLLSGSPLVPGSDRALDDVTDFALVQPILDEFGLEVYSVD